MEKKIESWMVSSLQSINWGEYQKEFLQSMTSLVLSEVTSF